MQIDLNTEEGKAELQKRIDQVTEGLKAKTSELLATNKKLKDDMKAFQDQIDEIKREKEEAEEAAAKKSGDVDSITKALEAKHKKEIEALAKEREADRAALNETLIDGGLISALTKAGIAPQHVDTVLDHIKVRNKAEIVEAEGKRIAQIGGKTIDEFVTEFSQGEKGKHYFAAGNNSGGGSQGANSGGQANGTNRSKMSTDDKAKYIRENGQEAYLKLPE